MKTTKFFPIIITLIFLSTSCITTSVADIQSKSNNIIKIYTTKLPEEDYIEVKYISASGSIFSSPERLLYKLSLRAKKEGGDAIIDVKFSSVFWWPEVSGIVIKFK